MLGDWCGSVRDLGRASGACDQVYVTTCKLWKVACTTCACMQHQLAPARPAQLCFSQPLARSHSHRYWLCPMNAPPFPCRIPWSWWSAENRRSGEIEKKIGRSLVRVRSAGRTNNGRDRHAPRTLGYCVCIRVATGQLPLAVLARWSG